MKIDCPTCGLALETAYKNAYCVPAFPKIPACAGCRADSHSPDRTASRTVFYYKTCQRDTCETLTYETKVDLDENGKIKTKAVKKRACAG